MLTVYVPRPSSRLAATLQPGAGLVGTPDGSGRVACFYQPQTPAVNIRNFADRIFHAADRLRADCSTHMRVWPSEGELVAVGVFDETQGRVMVDDAAAGELARWLGGAVDPEQLQCDGVEHFQRRRDWETAAGSPNPAVAQFARQQLARMTP